MITEQKEQFPKLDDVEWIMVKVPEWFFGDRANGLISNQKYNCGELSSWAITSTVYNEMQKVHENSKDFKVTWQLKQTDPHADIKAEYKKALKIYDVVKVFCSHKESSLGWSKIDFKSMCDYKDDEFKFELRFYNIDWNKLLSWSYANGEFVECEFADFRTFENVKTHKILAYDGRSFCANNTNGDWFANCRLAPHVTIKDEWLKEVK